MEMPDYDYIIKLLYVISAKEQFEFDFVYDWHRKRRSVDMESSMFPHSEIGSQLELSASNLDEPDNKEEE
jgi:hypothetical protein